MSVQSYLSLYTYLLGWRTYDSLWQFFADIGVLAIPFGIIALKAFYEPWMGSANPKQAGVVGTKRLVVFGFIGIMVLLISGVPMVRLNPNVMHFTPSCPVGAATAVPGKTGTTYDKIVAIPKSIAIPVWWYLVLAMSNGVTEEAKSFVSCPPVDLRGLQAELDTTHIQGAPLKAEVVRYTNECYKPAYAKYVREVDNRQTANQITQSLKKYGQDDVSWVGSETFQHVSGFYNAMYASSPVRGFPVTDSEEDKIQKQAGNVSAGTPSCLNWWSDSTHGLRHRLYNQFSSAVQGALARMDIGSVGSDLADDETIKALIAKSSADEFGGRGFSTEGDYQKGEPYYNKNLMYTGTIVHSWLKLPEINAIQNTLPIMQAVVEYLVFILLAPLIILSGYSLRFMLAASFFMFMLVFCSFAWHAITFLDNYLMQALYQAITPSGTPDWLHTVANIVDARFNAKEKLLNMTIGMFYMGAPVLFLLMGGWLGWKGSAVLIGGSELQGTSANIAGGAGKGLMHVASKFLK